MVEREGQRKGKRGKEIRGRERESKRKKKKKDGKEKRKDKQRQKLIHSIETMLAGIEMLNFTTLEKVITRSSYCICISLKEKE